MAPLTSAPTRAGAHPPWSWGPTPASPACLSSEHRGSHRVKPASSCRRECPSVRAGPPPPPPPHLPATPTIPGLPQHPKSICCPHAPVRTAELSDFQNGWCWRRLAPPRGFVTPPPRALIAPEVATWPARVHALGSRAFLQARWD